MPLLRPGIRRLFRLDARGRAATSRDVDDEMALHVELRAEQLVREGLDADRARDEARRLFAQTDASLAALYTSAEERNASALGWPRKARSPLHQNRKRRHLIPRRFSRS